MRYSGTTLQKKDRHDMSEEGDTFWISLAEKFFGLILLIIGSILLYFKATITPKAINQGAKTTPTTPTVAGISSKRFPLSSITIIRVTFPSCNSSLTLSTRLLPETLYSSRLTFATAAPQTGQNLSSSFNTAPQFVQ